MSLLGDTFNPHFVKEALLSGVVHKALVESFVAAQYRDVLSDPEIVLAKVLKGNLAYGIALNGEAKRLTTCMKRYFIAHQQEILAKLSKELLPSEVRIHRSTG